MNRILPAIVGWLAASLSLFGGETSEEAHIRVGYQLADHEVTVDFLTEEMPEFYENESGIQTYALYKLASPLRTGYQFSHLGGASQNLEKTKEAYLNNFRLEVQKIGAVDGLETIPFIEDKSKGVYSYITKAKVGEGSILVLFSDFYEIKGQIYVVAQIRILVEGSALDNNSGKDIAFFQSLLVKEKGLVE